MNDSAQIKIIVNGEEMLVKRDLTVSGLIDFLGLDIKKIAVEKDFEIVGYNDFKKTVLLDGNKVEIVHFIGGG